MSIRNQPLEGRAPRRWIGSGAMMVVALSVPALAAISLSPITATGQAVPDKAVPDNASRDGAIGRNSADDPYNSGFRSHTVAGIVLDEKNAPVAAAQVWLVSQTFYSDRNLLTAQTRSGKDGRFGPLTLKVLRERGPFPQPVFWIAWAYSPGHSLSATVGEASVKIVLRPPADTAFVILAPDGKPLAGAVVEPHMFIGPHQVSGRGRGTSYVSGEYWIVPYGLRQAVRGTTGADGRVRLPGVPRDTLCAVEVTSQEHGTWVQHFDASNKPISAEKVIHLRSAGRVEGRVVSDDPQAARGISISLTTCGAGRPPVLSESYGRAEVISDDQGRFVVPAIAKGSLTTRAQIDEDSPFQPVLPQELTVREAATTQVEIRLLRPVRIESVVRNKETGEPLAGVYVSVQSEGSDRSQHITSDKQGKITARVLPGTLKLNAAIPLPNGGQNMNSLRAKSFSVPAGVERLDLPPLEVNVGTPAPADYSEVEQESFRRNLPNILMDWGVRQDIELTDEQLLKYAEVCKRSIRSARGDPRERAKQTEELNKQLEDMLTPAQIARLKQIRLQLHGVGQFTFPSATAAALQISDEQREKFGAVQSRYGQARSKVDEQLKAVRDDRNLSSEERDAKESALKKELARLRDTADEEVLAVLTPEQREKFEKMKGPKFAGFAATPAPARMNPDARPGNWCMMLMEFKTVQKDLNLTGDQQAKLHNLLAKAEVAPDLMSYVGPYERERTQAELEKTAEGILSPGQTARINEIYVQLLGADALSDPAAVEALRITEQQTANLKTIKEKFKENNKWRPIDEATIAEAVAVLTPDQRGQFEKMKGAKFDMSAFRAEGIQRRSDKAP